MNTALLNAQQLTKGGGTGARGFGGGGGQDFISLVGQLPGIGGDFASQARNLRSMADAQEQENTRSFGGDMDRAGPNTNIIPGMSPNFDPVKVAAQIYPILEFRDKIVKAISSTISKIPGLEKLLEHISETLTAFVLGLLAPFVRWVLRSVGAELSRKRG